MATVQCPKCNARVEFEAGTKFVKCSYCGSQIYIDKSGAGFYYIIPYMVKENDAVGTFRRWAAGSTKAKDLDKLAQLAGIKRQYFPVYYFKRDVDGKEQVMVEPAGSTTLPGLHRLKVVAGDMKIFDSNYDVGGIELIKPDIEMITYFDQLPGKPKEQSLVYFPIWHLDYVFQGKKYEVVIDGSSGEVFASEFPMRGSGAYMAMTVVGFVAFFAETLLTVVYPVIAVGLMAVTVAGIFAGAFYVARRK